MANDHRNASDVKKNSRSSRKDSNKNNPVSTYRLITVPESFKGKENNKFYLEIENLLHGIEIINSGDCVLVAGPTDKKKYIARVLSFHENRFAKEINASVRWFYSTDEIPKKLCSDDVHPNEIFLSAKETADNINVETIMGKCCVKWIPLDEQIQKSFGADEFFYQRLFNGKNFSDISNPNAENSEKSLFEQRNVVNASRRIRQTPSRYRCFEFHNGKPKGSPESTPILHSSKRVGKSAKTDSVARAKVPLIQRPTFENSPIKSPMSQVEVCQITSPVSASGFGKLGASAVALDIWNTDDQDDCEDAMSVSSSSSLEKPKKNLVSSKRGKYRKNDSKLKILEAQKTPSTKLNMGSNEAEIARNVGKIKVVIPKAHLLSNIRNEKPANCQRSSPRTKPFIKSKVADTESDSESESSSDKSYHENIPGSKSVMRGRIKSAKQARTTPSDIESDFESDVQESSSDDSYQEKKLSRKLKSPKRARIVRKTTVTPILIKTPRGKLPFIPSRPTPVRSAKGNLEKSRERLHVSAIPECLPCRENEFQEVYTFVEGKIRSGGGGCIYVSGVPGTGKTATVREVMNCLQNYTDKGDLPEFRFVDINGMRLTEPRQAYVQLLLQLTEQKATADHAANLLTKLFSQRRKMSTVVLADELDLLWTRKQDVLYHLFDWPTHRHAKLIVVAIANTMDLPERILMNRVSSRLGLTRLTFRPYSFKQLQEIIASRLNGLDTFESDAIQLVSRKVAAVSGDARRCLDICRRATEIAERKKRKVVGIEHVHSALQEMFATPMIQAMRACSKHEQLFLHATVAEFRRSGMEEATLARIIKQHSAISQLEGAAPVTVSTLVRISQQLATNRLILLEGGNKDLFARVRLNVSVDDVLFSLKQ